MKTQVSFQRCTGYLRVKCSGQFPAITYREILVSIRDEAAISGDTCVLVDALEVGGPDSDMDRFHIGASIAELFGYRIKVAVLYPPPFINKFAENVATNRGASMLVVGEEEVALQWLLGPAARSATDDFEAV